MQYLSKAYSYYSGINPATLSGAIDVIVVKHVDADGEITLSSSPFHVRFGKLQVLRAGEKRVTLHLPNNLPAPHVAPFNMKVGEAGEAFFVLETEEEVPEELLTSPVVMATDADYTPPSPPPSDEEFNDPLAPSQADEKPPLTPNKVPGTSTLTHQPFGETEEVVKHDDHDHLPQNGLGEVDFLDLNESSPIENVKEEEGAEGDSQDLSVSQTSASAVSPSSLLNTASSLLPSIPFLSKSPPKESPVQDSKESIDEPATSSDSGVETKETTHSFGAVNPPNPMKAQAGESTELPEKDEKLSDLRKKHDEGHRTGIESVADNVGHGEVVLPKVKDGEGEGPEVVYGKDIVLDMGGYHSVGEGTEEREPLAEEGMRKEIEMVKTKQSRLDAAERKEKDKHQGTIKTSLIETFTQDLLSSAQPHAQRPILPSSRFTDPALSTMPASSLTNLEATSTPDLPSSLAAQALNEPESPSASPSSSPRRSKFDRGQSEPPQSPEPMGVSASMAIPNRFPQPNPPTTPKKLARIPNGTLPVSPVMSGNLALGMDYAWDWGRLPSKEAGDRDDGGVEDLDHTLDLQQGKLKNVEEDPYLFVLEMDNGRSHAFELSLCGIEGQEFSQDDERADEEDSFWKGRITFQKFIEDPHIVDDPRLVVRYSLLYLTWTSTYGLLFALAMYRRSLLPPNVSSPMASLPPAEPRPSSGYGWSRWWRRGQSSETTTEPPQPQAHVQPRRQSTLPVTSEPIVEPPSPPATLDLEQEGKKQYAKTLRLSSDQLKELNLKPGPNTIKFSVTSSYSGLATCTARIFLWDDTDQIVISDIDGTITKSDALGHVFAAIGRDWTHLGIAKLYTDIANNGYKILYLTSRAIGQADSTREYLKTINQGDYRLPEGPVIMSPDRLMASLHREVIMRKPELFKMACLRDIQRLFGDQAKEAFYAGFGNRITDAMSYRSVGIETSKIYTIDSTGVVKTELLQSAGHKGSYIQLNDLVDEVFPQVSTKHKPEFTDFNFWKQAIPDYIQLPDLSPPSPTLSARSDTSGGSRMSVLGKIASIGRRSSKPSLLPSNVKDVGSSASRPSSPLMGPAMTADEEDDAEEGGNHSMPGSFEDDKSYWPERYRDRKVEELEEGRRGKGEEDEDEDEDERGAHEGDSFDDEELFDDDLLATGEMQHVPF